MVSFLFNPIYLFKQALKYRSVTNIVRHIRKIVHRREKGMGHSVRPKENWNSLFVTYVRCLFAKIVESKKSKVHNIHHVQIQFTTN